MESVRIYVRRISRTPFSRVSHCFGYILLNKDASLYANAYGATAPAAQVPEIAAAVFKFVSVMHARAPFIIV